MANIQVRVDEGLKKEAQEVAASLGMEVATAIRIFLCQMVRDKALPFTPSLRQEVVNQLATSKSQAKDMELPHSREEWLRQAVHVGLIALENNDVASEQEIKDMFIKAGANVS